MDSFTDNLKTFRQLKGMTQQQVADEIGISQGNYSGLESGKFQPSLNTLKLLADLFGQSIDELVGFIQFVTNERKLGTAEQDLLESYNNMSYTHQGVLLAIARVMEEEDKSPNHYRNSIEDEDVSKPQWYNAIYSRRNSDEE